MSAAAPFRELASSGLRGFVGGLNIRDAVDELVPTESPDLWNVVLDERGGFGSRLGMAKWNATPFSGSALVQNIFEWRKGGHIVTQVGASLYLDSTTTAFKTFTTADRCGFAEFAGKLMVIHPVDGLFTSDGTSGGTAVVATAPKGTTLAVWQNRLWAAGDGTARLYFSAIGSATQWTPDQTTLATAITTTPQATITVASTAGFDPAGAFTLGAPGGTQDTIQYTGVTATTFTGCTGNTHTFPVGTVITQGKNYNDLIEKDEQPLTCLRGASGQDIIGQPGLIVFKKRSTYRVNDSNTGAYTTLDPMIGTPSNISAVATLGRVYSVTADGICWTDGRGPMRIESDKLRPLWKPDQLNFPRADLWCAGRRGTHLVFSVPTVGQTHNTLALEHYPAGNPKDASTVIGSNAASCYCTITAGDETLISGSPTVNGQVYKNGFGGTDDGQPIHAYYQTAWVAPHPERLARIRSAIFEGHGDFTAFTRQDYSRGQGSPSNVHIAAGNAGHWNDAGRKWNDGGLWGPDGFAGYSDTLPSLGVCRVISFRVEATTTNTRSAPGLSGSKTAPVVGSWAVYAIHLKTVPLRQL